MKYLLSLFIVISMLQPLPLQACDMDMDKHAGHHQAEEPVQHDCCDPGEDSTQHQCADMVSCASCALGLTLVAPESSATVFGIYRDFASPVADDLATPHPSPPFRPPIA